MENNNDNGSDSPFDISGLLNGDRRSLARSITLIESSRVDHRAEAEELLDKVMPNTGGSIRIGISGPPGVGKSTFIESFGQYVIRKKQKIAVLTVDPSSKCSGGSILGDKTRMPKLGQSDMAFIRPSPAGITLGGVARRTREAILLCESAGYDIVLVETVGVGQSEYAVSDMVDMFVLLAQPVGGDDLQGIKRGVMELADLIIVTKADGDLKRSAMQAENDLKSGISLLKKDFDIWKPKVLTCSSITGEGMEEVWSIIQLYQDTIDKHGELQRKRGHQARTWMWSEVQEALVASLRESPLASDLAQKFEVDVVNGRLAPTVAARKLLKTFMAGN